VIAINVFDRLLSLYKKNRNSNKMPLEDYTTELLVAILESDNEILDDYVNNVLLIEGQNFNITSQEKHFLEGDKNCIIDIVIKNDNIICFIENKVDASEGERQLERYSKVLNSIKRNENKDIYLRYCTKYYDRKDVSNIDFLQYRWSEVYKFLTNYEEENIIKEYLDFLRGEGMASAGDFNFNDLIAMTAMNTTIAKMDECLDLVKPKMIELFGNPYQYDYERLKQICKNMRYSMWCTDITGTGYSEVMIGFEFTNEDDSVAPNVVAQIYIGEDNSQYTDLKDEIFKSEIFDYIDTSEGFLCWFEKPLSDFISSKNQNEEISNWFCENLQKIYELEQLGSLTWNS
jgi:hypothetical protein